MLCAVYCRLSKEDEEKQLESESIQNQKAMLAQYAEERGWDIYQIYCDEDYSGADRFRPGFNRMLRDAEAGRFQVILCKTQSRFTRDMELVEKYIHGAFPLWGIRFIAIADNVDTEVKGNKKARQINGLVNEWYLEDLSENIRMVFDHKRRSGQYIGGSPLYGYRKDPGDKNRLIIDPEAAEVVRQIFRWSLEGQGKQSIAGQLNERGVPNPTRYKAERGLGSEREGECGLWNKTSVWRILHNEMYTGVMVQGRRRKVSYKSKTVVDIPEARWYRVEGTHEAIIDRETFEAVQKGLGLRLKSGGAGEAHVLAGLVKCMDCGSTMCKSTSGDRSYLRCKRYADGGKRRLCSRHAVRLDALIELVSERVRLHIQHDYTLGELELETREDGRRKAAEEERKRLALQLEKRSSALKSLYLDKVSGVLGEAQFLELNQAFLEEKGRIERRLSQIEEEWAAGDGREQHSVAVAQAEELLRPADISRELAVMLIEKIEVGERNKETGEQKIRIYWNY